MVMIMSLFEFKPRKPIFHEGGEYATFTVKELTVDELIALEKGDTSNSRTVVESDKHYFALACGVSPAVIGLLSQSDFNRLRRENAKVLGNLDQEHQT